MLNDMSIILSKEHTSAANRVRRTILQYDARTVATECGGLKALENTSLLDAYRMRLWGYVDSAIGQLDSIHWDACFSDEIAFCHKSVMSKENQPIFKQLFQDGVDIYDEFISGCRKRGLECILTHRVSGPDVGGEHSFKKTHPEYYIMDWCLNPDFSHVEIHDLKLHMFEEIISNYDFDGYEIDFCRHTPFLTPGHQWDLRDHVTNFMYKLRLLTLKAEEKWHHPVLLSARIPETADNCRGDGLDLRTWAQNHLVDTLTIGSRSFEVDIESIRRETEGAVKLYPCFDAHHQTDAYADPNPEVLYGVFSNWWAQGADGISLFNLYACDWATYIKTCEKEFTPHRHPLEQILPVLGDEKLLSPFDKTYVVERRGGYPWEHGYANNNNTKQLPLIISNDGTPRTVILYAGDPIAHNAANVSNLYLDVELFGVRPEDTTEVVFNGILLNGEADFNYPDKQIKPLQPEHVSGYHTDYLPDRSERFMKIHCPLQPGMVTRGHNFITVSVRRTYPYPYTIKAELERVELAVKYRIP